MPPKKLIFARVRCISRKTKEFFDRDFWLELSTLPDDKRCQVEGMTKSSVSGEGFCSIRSLLHHGPMPADVTARADEVKGFAVTDYFEDEDGNPLDSIGLAQILHGEEYPILLYDVRSVLRLGPTGMLRKEIWNTEAANTLAHFFQLVEIIGTSDWLKTPLSLNTPCGEGSPPWINSFQCPNLAQTYSILLPIRQLYSEDNALNNACNVYLRHVEDERKQWWVKETKREFNAFLTHVPQPHTIEGYTVRQLLDLVMYGAGLVHYARSDHQTKQAFKDAVTRHQREWVIFLFLMHCQHLYAYANRLYFVLRQDCDHWISNAGTEPPDLLFMRGLFESHRLRSDEIM